jgi:hypothetical protein
MNVTKLTHNISIRKQVSVNLSASQWELSTSGFSRVVIEKVADILNRRLVLSFNSGKSKADVEVSMVALMKDFSMYGANSKPTKVVLDRLLKSLYSV